MFENIVIIHGIGGLEKEPYFLHLKSHCEKLGLKVFMPSLGSYRENITYKDWAEYFDKNILTYMSRKTVVVAQSVGTQFAVKYLTQKNTEVGLYISCAGPRHILVMRESAPERGKLKINPVSKFFEPTDAEFEIFKNFTFPKFSFYSNNDKWFEERNLEKYADEIGSTKMFLPQKSHFDEIEVFAELENLISEQLKKI